MKKGWDLDHIVKMRDFEKLYKSVSLRIKRVDDAYSYLYPAMKNDMFRKIIKYTELLKSDLSRLYHRASLMEAADQKSHKAMTMKSRVRDLYVRAMDSMRKIDHWIMGKKTGKKHTLDNKNAGRLFTAVKDMEYVLRYARKFRKHTLDEPLESLITGKNINGVEVLVDLRTLVETEFEYEFKPRGRRKPRKINTSAELMSYASSGDSSKREAAYRALLEKYRDNIDKFFLIYQSIIKDWNYEAKLRGYRSPISVRNRDNHISDAVVELLLDVCASNRTIFMDYFRFKAGELGVKKMRRYDIYAPLAEDRKKIPYGEALQLTVGTLRDFSEDFADKAQEIINAGHIDPYPSAVKQGGAFCATVSPRIKPYILLNYTGKFKDVLTLAHELGHGIHSIYAENLSYSAQGSSLPLAETASTFCEMIMFEKILTTVRSRREKKALIMDKLADSYATILRQNYFVIFELSVYGKIGKGLTPEDISRIYYDNLKEQFGGAVDVDPLFRYEWAYIPHLVNTPFYCYAYNFGELLSMALYSEYKKRGRQVVKSVERILSSGGSCDPAAMLKEEGIDIGSRKFWQEGFDMIKDWVEELRSL
ncbi:MAG: M3 family oligoendopeptidase [Elusimicrobia bacterium]|nr:M3 family oligoendopeptidase [Elusimicrobiota bacterium]